MIRSCPVTSGGMASLEKLTFPLYHPVQRGDEGSHGRSDRHGHTTWDVFMMRRGRGAVVVSVKTSMVRSCPVNSGDMASLECRLMG